MSALASSDPEHLPVSAGEAVALFAGLAGEARLLIAVSGGPDSVALLSLLQDWSQQPNRPALHAATVDHGLREASSSEAEAVGALCSGLRVPHVILRWAGPKPATGIQQRAREARYALLAAHAEALGGAVLVTAHTLDDQAETMMMRMARGSGPSGLAGMRARVRKNGTVLARPLLAVPKARLIATAEARGLSYIRDPSNADPRFERARWRTLMPILADEGLTAERLTVLAARLARMDAAIEHQVALLLPSLTLAGEGTGVTRLRFGALVDLPEEIALRVVAEALALVPGSNAELSRLERLEGCVFTLLEAAGRGTAMTRTLSGCVLALDRDGVLTLTPEPPRRRGVHPASR
ncbi:tRNA lysidine(34) synthetase TilS [Bosea sp. BIWAKO-01]|uniref:tRNA lysidine(34) synthetase TilS n=1 Tax=Bosea sp. BIWAKO-01 TaxID=506668 RepID=UPI000869FA71|nr:tRNA lysidine(34) synthetase TilS [Bosea sp. BIWAKO-01]GAU83314.1 tRNA(Ile)-lysidine synthetase [Bosea sp. BIWAKO-01]